MDSIMFRLSLSLLLCVRVCVRIHQGLGHSLQRANYCGTYERHPEEAEEKDPHAALLDSGYFRQPARHVEKVNIYIPNEPERFPVLQQSRARGFNGIWGS